MAKLLRKVKQNRWYKADAQIFLDCGDVPADPLGDLNTSQNRLSVFRVDEDLANIERIARAIASGGDRLDNVGYVLFDTSLLEKASIEMDTTDGETVDSVVNKCHADLTNLTGTKLVTLTRLILLEGESNTILKKRIVELVREGVDSKELPEKVRAKLPQA
ncbi:MAG: hypothetical protein ACYCSP_11450 [Acidobacteriaceae bacterium]